MAKHATPSAQYAITMRLEYPHAPGWIAKIAAVIASEGGAIAAIDLVHIAEKKSLPADCRRRDFPCGVNFL